MFARIRSSLTAKVSLLVTVVALVFLALLYVVSVTTQRAGVIEEIRLAQSRLQRMSRLVIWTPMTEGNDELTRKMFSQIAGEFKGVHVHLCDFNADLTYSTDPKARGQNVSGHFDAGVAALVGKALKTEGSYDALFDTSDPPLFVAAKSVPNAPECYHCHGKSQPILGALVVVSDVGASLAGIRTFAGVTGLMSLGMLVCLIAATLYVLRRLIIRRLRALAGNTETVTSGNFDVVFDVRGSDEMASLSRDLQTMIATLKDHSQYQESVLDGISAPFFVTDRSLAVIRGNDPLLELLGLPRHALHGLDARSILAGKDLATGAALAVSLRREAQRGRAELEGRGRRILVDYCVSGLTNAQGEVVGVIGLLVDVTRDEEARSLIEGQQKNLLALAEQVTSLAISVSEENTQVVNRVGTVNEHMGDVSARTEQVASAMEEMNSTVIEVAKNAQQTSSSAETAKNAAVEGGKVIEQTIRDILAVADTSKTLAGHLQDLSHQTSGIGRVIVTISEIADQTNLLALNAAIEAARAGEAGRGFAVVADEVRKLAEKTMGATKEVEDSINKVRISADRSVEEMERTAEMIGHTSHLAAEAGESLKRIMDFSDSIADMIRDIATAAEQQSATSEEINTSTTAINSLSKETMADLSQAAEDLSKVAGLSQRLKELVTEFGVDAKNQAA